VNTSPASINRYSDEGEVEKNPIGFKQKSTLTPPANRYTMVNAKKKETNAEKALRYFG
jgi:hypothetical protein